VAARAVYEDALRQRPQDHWLHHNYAEFLVGVGDLPQAIVQMQAVRDLLPYHHAAYFQLGRLLARQKQFIAAREYLEDALRLRRRSPKSTWNWDNSPQPGQMGRGLDLVGRGAPGSCRGRAD